MQAVLQLIFRGLAHQDNLAGEMQVLAGHLVIEVHSDVLVADFYHRAGHHAAVGVHHRNHVAFKEQFLCQAVALHKDVLGEVDYGAGVVLAITLGGSETEVEFVAHLLAGDVLFELGQQIACAKDEFQRAGFIATVCNFAIYLEFVYQMYYFVLSNFHKLSFIY